jgi:hypothetical protein
MKWLLIIIVLITANAVSAQHRFKIELGTQKGGFKDTLEILQRVYKVTMDSFDSTYKFNKMPNAFVRSLLAPALVGNNGKGHNIYILPIDYMPMIKPDSSYSSNMPTGFWRSR